MALDCFLGSRVAPKDHVHACFQIIDENGCERVDLHAHLSNVTCRLRATRCVPVMIRGACCAA